MKRLVLFILTLNLMLLSACSVSDPPETTPPSETHGVEDHEFIDSSQTESQESSENQDTEMAGPESIAASDRNEIKEGSTTSDAAPEPGHTSVDEPQSNSNQSAPPPQTQNQSQPVVVPDIPKSSNTPEPKPQETTPPAEPVQSKEPNAGASDEQAVADAVLAYINQYRTEQGSSPAVKLSGLAEYARYRSEQLISNFAHDTDDERAAATALQYGDYIDPALFGITGDPYYTVNAREAIAKGGYSGTVDNVAKSLAQLVKNSAGHWSYVGSSEYGYIAVGVTYRSGMWYCDIAMARENTDEK